MIQEGLTDDRSDERSSILYAERMIYAHVVDLSVVFYDSDALSFDESSADEVTATMTDFCEFTNGLRRVGDTLT
tara:strand:+ start:355 stop:576 length:222 start_codon:yes stop_codon:yes gene_type:complete